MLKNYWEVSKPVKPKAFPEDPEMARGGLETEVSVWADANLKLKKYGARYEKDSRVHDK